MSHEVASLMLKLVNLWQCLSDRQVIRLKEEISNSLGIQKLVSEDDDYLMDLVVSEMIRTLRYVGKAAAVLGKKCIDPTYHNLELVFNGDPIEIDPSWDRWEYRLKKMERRAKKMERFVASTSQLYQELDVLAELEQTLRRMQARAELGHVKLLEFQQKVVWQRQKYHSPDFVDKNDTFELGVLGWKLCMVVKEEREVGSFRVLEMKEYGNGSSWNELFRFKINNGPVSMIRPIINLGNVNELFRFAMQNLPVSMRPIMKLGNMNQKHVLLEGGVKLYCFDMERGLLKNVKINNACNYAVEDVRYFMMRSQVVLDTADDPNVVEMYDQEDDDDDYDYNSE